MLEFGTVRYVPAYEPQRQRKRNYTMQPTSTEFNITLEMWANAQRDGRPA